MVHDGSVDDPNDLHDRNEVAGAIPQSDYDTPLAQEAAEDARRRIILTGRPMPKPTRTRVFTVANQKGGVGKTTTTVNLAASMAQAGLNVLVIDNDPQGNASTALSVPHTVDVPNIYDVLVDEMPLSQVVQRSPEIDGLWCAPASLDLAGAEIELVPMVARESRLRNALDRYLSYREEQGLSRLDYVFVDCPPSLGLLTVNAFVVAREVLIPIQCEYYALEGLSQLLKNIELIKGHLNPELDLSTILLTMYDGRTNLSSQVADEVRSHFSSIVLKTTVPRTVRVSEAPSYGQTVITYDPTSNGALSYLAAAREIAERGADPKARESSSAAATYPDVQSLEELPTVDDTWRPDMTDRSLVGKALGERENLEESGVEQDPASAHYGSSTGSRSPDVDDNTIFLTDEKIEEARQYDAHRHTSEAKSDVQAFSGTRPNVRSSVTTDSYPHSSWRPRPAPETQPIPRIVVEPTTSPPPTSTPLDLAPPAPGTVNGDEPKERIPDAYVSDITNLRQVVDEGNDEQPRVSETAEPDIASPVNKTQGQRAAAWSSMEAQTEHLKSSGRFWHALDSFLGPRDRKRSSESSEGEEW